MEKATILLSAGILALVIALTASSKNSNEAQNKTIETTQKRDFTSFEMDPYLVLNSDENILKELIYIDENDNIELGFDTKAYLPEGFNAYEGMSFEIDEIEYIEIEEDVQLGFNTKDYLPEGFNPYSMPELNIADIEYIEDEEVIELGFDTKDYLPIDFVANKK